MTTLQFEALHPDFGARVTGLELTNALSDREVGALHEAIDTYSLLCFPNQKMTDEHHLSLTRQLGQPEAEHVTFGKTGNIVYLGTIGNVNEDGTKKDNAHVHTKYQQGNNIWHSDSSFRQLPSYVSINHAYEVPGEGGITEFVSMRMAYSRLNEETRQMLASLTVLHDYVFSRSPVATVDPNHAASLPPVKHPLIRTNPRNGKKNLYIGSHARSIVGYSGIDSRCLLDDLLAQGTQPQHIYAHSWQVGDTVIWDNRCLLHRGTGYNADKWRRYMRQTRVMGTEAGVI